MRTFCTLCLLLLSLPTAAWAGTTPVKVGKSTLSPQQVQFMRWWRSQTIKVVKPTAKPVAQPASKTTLRLKVTPHIVTVTPNTVTPRQVAPRKVTGRNVKVVRIKANVRRQVQVPNNGMPRAVVQGATAPSLLTLKALLINTQSAPAAGFNSNSGSKLTVVQGSQRVVRRERSVTSNVTSREVKQPLTINHAASRLVIVQQPSTGAPAPPNTLTTLRYQLELAQME